MPQPPCGGAVCTQTTYQAISRQALNRGARDGERRSTRAPALWSTAYSLIYGPRIVFPAILPREQVRDGDRLRLFSTLEENAGVGCIVADQLTAHAARGNDLSGLSHGDNFLDLRVASRCRSTDGHRLCADGDPADSRFHVNAHKNLAASCSQSRKYLVATVDITAPGQSTRGSNQVVGCHAAVVLARIFHAWGEEVGGGLAL